MRAGTGRRMRISRVLLCLLAIQVLTAWAPTRTYYPPWISLSDIDPYRDFSAKRGAVISLGRFAPQNPVVTAEKVIIEGGRNTVAAGTVLVQIENKPFTACEMVRPQGHESFYCFVDQDGDGRFDGVYHLFSNSYFLLSGWTNRIPVPITPATYSLARPDSLPDHINVDLELAGANKDRRTYLINLSSKERKDFWVNLGKFSIERDKAGKAITILGTRIVVSAFTDSGPILDITPPNAGFVAHFMVPMDLDKRAGGSEVVGEWVDGGAVPR